MTYRGFCLSSRQDNSATSLILYVVALLLASGRWIDRGSELILGELDLIGMMDGLHCASLFQPN